MGEALDWLSTPAARQAAHHNLDRRRLPAHLVDDVLQLARVRVLRQEQAHLVPPDAPVAVARRALTNVTIDLLRRRASRPVEVAWDPDLPVAVADPSGALDEDAARRAVLAARAHPAHRSAALSLLTLTLHPDVAVPAGAPEPVRGNDEQRAEWAALWLAGERCFPPDDAATRQRRSRASKAVKKLLAEVLRSPQVTRGS